MVVTGSYKARWVARGETVRIQGVSLFAGMFYVGRTFEDADGHDKYIVNPSLPIGASAKDYYPGHDPFNVSYEALPPSGRRAYIEWISGSCRATNVPVNFMRMYASGLYRRVLVENGADRETVIAEARRLLAHHAGNAVFRDLLSSLLVFSTAGGYAKGQMPVYRAEWRQSCHVAAEVLLRIGSVIAANGRIGSDDAFLYALELCKIGLKPDTEIEAVRLLWKRIFAGRFPDGIRAGEATKKIDLRLAMPDGVSSIRVFVPTWCRKLPDPRSVPGLDTTVTEMFRECASELSKYSKLVKKSPGARGSLEAVNVLPKQLVATSMAGRFAGVKASLDNALSKQGVVSSKVMSLFQFMELPFKEDGELSAAVRKLISGAMDKMDIAFEPDARFGAAGFTTKGHLVFFRGENGLHVDYEGAYAVHRACADFLMGHVCKSGSQSAMIERTLFEARRKDNGLSENERLRLAAHARSLSVDFGISKPAPFKQSKLDEDSLARLCELVVAIVGAMPDLDNASISAAEKFVERLGGDRRSLHSAMHRGQSVERDGLVTVLEGTPARGVRITGTPVSTLEPSPSAPLIDMDRLRRIEAETALVAVLLDDIFSEGAGGDDEPPEKQDCANLMGLDDDHAGILEEVMVARTMTRDDFDSLVKARRLMPDGVIETINDRAFDVIGEPVIFEENGVTFEESLRERLEETRVVQ